MANGGQPDGRLDALVEQGLAHVWSADLPPRALGLAKLAIADFLGTTLAGSRDSESVRLREAVLRSALTGPSTVVGTSNRTDPVTAAFLNASAGTVLELDDRLPQARAHPGVHVIASAIASAESVEASGRRLLHGVVVGYEAAHTLGQLLPGRPDWLHPHGYISTIAAAIGVAFVRQLPLHLVRHVVGVAASITPVAPFGAAWAGATVRNAFSGFACQASIRSVDCVEGGLTGYGNALEELAARAGVAIATPQTERPSRLAIELTSVKLLPCCFSLHACAQALRRIASDTELAEIDSITVRGPARLARFMEKAPATRLAAQFSLPFVLGYEAVHGLSPASEFDPCDNAVLAVASRVDLSIDDSDHSVTVVAQGRERSEPVGEPVDIPLQEVAVRDKFGSLNGDAETAGLMWAYVERLEEDRCVRLP